MGLYEDAVEQLTINTILPQSWFDDTTIKIIKTSYGEVVFDARHAIRTRCPNAIYQYRCSLCELFSTVRAAMQHTNNRQQYATLDAMTQSSSIHDLLSAHKLIAVWLRDNAIITLHSMEVFANG